MLLHHRAAALLYIVVETVIPSVTGTAASSCGFIISCAPLTSQQSSARGAGRMALSEETEASSSSASSDIESTVGNLSLRESPLEANINQPRRAEPPPSVEAFQTTNQRRRARPLSQLKRVKPKNRRETQDEAGEFRPLIAKTDRESVLRGEDYWIDYRELDAARARKVAKAKAPAPDQFAQSKMKAEIVNPYKQNWILVISIAITAMAAFIRINPDVLNDAAISTFPTEL